MHRIVTLTPNPALDEAASIARLEPDHKLRCDTPRHAPGGGGVNVARVLNRLGAPVRAVTAVGGSSGQRLFELLQAEGVPVQPVQLAADTRRNLAVRDRSTGQEYRFVLPGAPMTVAEWEAFAAEALAAVVEAVACGASSGRAAWVVASGGLPPGMDAQPMAALLAGLRANPRTDRARLALDADGPLLAAALAQGVDLVKPNLRELREHTRLPLNSLPERAHAARALIGRGQAAMVALSLGPDGALLATAEGVWQARTPAVQVLGTTGAGDTLLAALIDALDRGEPPPAAIAWAVAASAATVESGGLDLCRPERVRALRPQVRVEAVAA